MTTLKSLSIGFLILLIAIGAFWRVRYHKSQPTRVVHKVAPEDRMSVYLGLRNLILQGNRSNAAPAPSSPTEPWAVLMDMGMTKETATIVAVSDGI